MTDRRTLVRSFLFLCLPLVAVCQQNGLVAAYSFDEGSGSSVSDASGKENKGTIGTATWAAAGRFGKALQFNGSTSMVTIPHSASLNLTTGMTLEAWVNPSAVKPAWVDVIYKHNDIFYLEASSPTGSRPVGGAPTASGRSETFAPQALAANTWTHLAVTYDGNRLRFYVNGAEVSNVARTGPILSSTFPVTIGGDPYGQYFTGKIDEVRIYNVARTAAQIQTDMNTAIGGNAAPPATAPLNSCDLNSDGKVTQADAELAVDMVLGRQPCTAKINGATVCNASLIQTVVNAATGSCGAADPVPPPPAHSVTLSWAASVSSGVVGYNVFRGSAAGSYDLLTPNARVTGTSYIDTSVQAGKTYYYVVTAVDSAGNSSSNSNQASTTVPTP